MSDIAFNVPFRAGNEAQYLEEVLARGFFAGNGPFTQRAQNLLAERYGVPQVLLTHSCTAALEMSALLHNIGPGDEVILPSYTFCTTAAAFLRCGATLVFCEIDPRTMAMDLDDAVSRVTDRTRAIVPVHYAGLGVDIATLRARLPRGDIAIIEDAAQAMEARREGVWLGTQGDVACFSFHETKNLHCGLGGALFLNREELFAQAEIIWERGTNRSQMFRGLVDKYSWQAVGSSFYPSELQAAFLYAQLEAVERNKQRRQAIWQQYYERLAEPLRERGLDVMHVDAARDDLNGHAFYLLCRSAEENDALRAALKRAGIHAVIHYVPLHSAPLGRELGYAPSDLPVTESAAPRVLRLPLHYDLSDAEVERVCAAVLAFFA